MDKSNSDSAVAVESATSPSGKKTAAKSKAKSKVRSTTSHPPTSEMVMAAIKELKDRKGSSLQAIKKYIVATYKVDGDKLAPFIKRYLKSAVTSGEVVQTKGKGASGSFKLPGSKTEAKPKSPKSPKAAAKAPKAAAQKSPKKDKAEKVKASPKKPKTVAEKTEKKKAAKAAIAIKPKATKAAKEKPVQAKAASKTKKTAKAPAAKTKTPKPKRSSTPSRAAAKK